MKMIGKQVVMPLNVAKMIDENDPVYDHCTHAQTHLRLSFASPLLPYLIWL